MSVELKPHRYIILPRCWPYPYKTCDHWWIKLVIDNGVMVEIAIKNLSIYTMIKIQYIVMITSVRQKNCIKYYMKLKIGIYCQTSREERETNRKSLFSNRSVLLPPY